MVFKIRDNCGAANVAEQPVFEADIDLGLPHLIAGGDLGANVVHYPRIPHPRGVKPLAGDKFLLEKFAVLIIISHRPGCIPVSRQPY